VYLYFLAPEAVKGQECIWVDGHNDGNMLAHAGSGVRAMVGTVSLKPNGALAMQGNRYAITEIGVENLAKRLVEVAEHDKQFGECEVNFFKDAKVNARTLMVLYPNRMQVVTVDGTGITKLSDLKGKRVSTGAPGSGVEVMALRVLEAVGIDAKKDIKQERLGAAESVNAIKDRKIDAFFWVGGVPTAALTDLAATPGTKIRLLDQVEALRRAGYAWFVHLMEPVPKGVQMKDRPGLWNWEGGLK
jgi:hypothetical protein